MATDSLPEREQIVVTARWTQPLDLRVEVGKTATPLAELPRSVQVISRELLDDQGATRLSDGLTNVSGVAQGGQFAFGFYDRVVIRGLNATYTTDGLPDASSDLGGIPHSLTGVERVEIMKGPGSALYGNSAQGGVINLVHYRPADRPGMGFSTQFGSFDSVAATAYFTGPSGLADVDFRLDAGYNQSDGFRGTMSRYAEFLPALSWRPAGHDFQARVEIRSIDTRPDAHGIPFSPPSGTGRPADVPVDNTYYTPFARGDQDIVRLLLSDAWDVAEGITVNNRFSYSNREVDILRNSGGAVALLGSDYGIRSRALRRQRDDIEDFLYQLEPRFSFRTGDIGHSLLTGFQAQWIDGHVTRATADLPNIASLAVPVKLDPAESALLFRCDATHSCADADISARLLSVYAVDQIDLSKALKLRLSMRHDWDRTKGVATSDVPANPGMQKPCLPPLTGECPWIVGVPARRAEKLLSWDVGAVYAITPAFSIFTGTQNSRYPIFNTEEPQSIGGKAEGGRQVEAGARLALDWVTISTAIYKVHRDSVFSVFVNPLTGFDEPTSFSYRVKGWEGDLNLNPVEHWIVIANFSRQMPEVSSFPQTPANVGKQVPSVPRLLANIWTDYELGLPQSDDRLRISLGVRYRGKSYSDLGNTRMIPSSTLVEGGIAWIHGGLQASVGVKNLLDKEDWQGGAGSGGGAIPGPVRSWFGRLAFRY